MANRTATILFAGLAWAICSTLPADAKPKLQSATIIQLYKKRCLAELKDLQGRLRSAKIMIRGTSKEAYKSPELACPFDKKNPTMKQLGNAKWIAQTDDYVSNVGIKAYILGSRQTMAMSMKQSGVLEILARAPKTGLTPQDLIVLGITMRASAFTEAHIEAVVLTYRK